MVSKSQIRKVMAALGSRKSEAKAKASRENGKLGGRPSEWRSICSAPCDGTRFIGRIQSPNKTSENKRVTWWGKTSHVPLCGWCHGRVENVDLWEPTTWKAIKKSKKRANQLKTLAKII